MRRRNKKNYIALILLFTVCISIGYAVLNATLTITGKSSISKNTWDVHFENVKVTSGSVEAKKVPTIENSTTVDFEAQLNLPGDFYEFTVDVVNNGTIDAMIESIEKTPELSTEQQEYLNYIIEYQNGEQISSKQLVKSNEFVRLKVRVELRKDIVIEDLPEVGDILNLGFTLNYVQDDGIGSSVTDNGVIYHATANGLLDDIGTIVTIGSEQFYTIGTEGDNVKLLSVHNLYVGGWYDNTTREWTPYGDEATGMQDENMLGFVSGQNLRKGTTAFSNTSGEYSGSIVEGYVNNYKTKLEENFGVDVVEARLITYEELISDKLGCNAEDRHCLQSPSWIYSRYYWTMSAYSENLIWCIFTDGNLSSDYYDFDYNIGVRPVIIIPKSEVKVDVKPVAIGDINEIGTIVTIGLEQFYTIGIEGDNVKLLSAMNITLDDEPKQSSNAVTTAFSNTSAEYSGSIVEGYVNNYKNIIETDYGVDIVDARLINYDELISDDIGCNAAVHTCSNAPSFISKTTYWSGSIFDAYSVWIVNDHGSFGNYYYTHATGAGVRPVIIISKSLF